MRKARPSTLKPGMVLGADLKVPSPQPDVLYKLRLTAGTKLTQTHIDRLSDLKITSVPIEDKATHDLDKFVYDPEVEAAEEEIQSTFTDLTTELDDQDVRPETLTHLQDTISDLIGALRDSELMAAYTSLKDHDSYTAQHSLDVTKISLQFAMRFEKKFQKTLSEETGASRQYIEENFLLDLGLGAMLHDLGKQDIDSDILNKSSDLTENEGKKMKAHPTDGYENLKSIAPHFSAPVRVPAHQHHEKFDGTGYPRQLAGKDIHLYGRITVCADVYSALTSNRPYRDPLPPPEALGVMDTMQENGPHFDPRIYEQFLDLVSPYPIGQEVTLTDGRSGVVCEFHEGSSDEPIVRVLFEDGERLDSPEELVIKNDSTTPQIAGQDSKQKRLIRN